MIRLNLKYTLLSGVLFILLMSASLQGLAQSEDSLKMAFQISKSDHSKAAILTELAWLKYEERDYTRSLQYLNEASQFARLSESRDILSESWYLQGQIYRDRNELSQALGSLLRARNLFEELQDSAAIAEVDFQMGDMFWDIQVAEKAAAYYEQGLLYLNRDKNEYWPRLRKLALFYRHTQDYDKAIMIYADLRQQALQNADYESALHDNHQIAQIMKLRGNYEQALKIDSVILQRFLAQEDSAFISLAYNNLAFDFFQSGRNTLAIENYQNALNFAGEREGMPKSMLLRNLSIAYQNKGNIDESLINLREAYRLASGRKRQQGEIAYLLGVVFYQKKDLYNAGLYAVEAINLAKSVDDAILLRDSYALYSKVLKDGNDAIRALDYYEKYLQVNDSIRFQEQMVSRENQREKLALEKMEKELQLSIAGEEVEDLALKQLKLQQEKQQNELELLRREKELEQSEKDRILQSLELTRERHASELREQELKQLEQEKAIQDLQLKQKEVEEKERQKEIALLQSERERQKLEIEKQAEAQKRQRITIALFALIIVLVLSGFIYARKQNQVLKKQKKEIEEKSEEIMSQNEEIMTQKELIEVKNEEITDSIQYASRIQEAVLPALDVMDRNLPKHFVFYRPKDIVSGDFYWAGEAKGHTVLAAVDCTGHGVPGAFMSMLGISFLNEIVIREEQLDAAAILERLRSEVVAALKQRGKEGEAQDGMDMALCIVSPEKKKLQFAGANNPLYRVRNGELEKFKADRMPVGFHHKIDVPFKAVTLYVKRGDCFYIFSDGYADQFGGLDKKKLKYRDFQKLLLALHSETFPKQGELLEKEFEKWKGDMEQIDDVLVIGFRPI